jgi:hypothetical protein
MVAMLTRLIDRFYRDEPPVSTPETIHPGDAPCSGTWWNYV